MLFQLLQFLDNPLMILKFVIMLVIPLLFSIVLHEVAHAYAAYKFGDPTAEQMGRLTLNPLKHLDFVGTILLLTVGFGWAKPVPVNILNIPNRTQQVLVALAGPIANILIVLIFSFLLLWMTKFPAYQMDELTVIMYNIIIKINILLAVFNLLPIPPLDGSKVLLGLLPESIEEKFQPIANYGLVVLMIIMLTVGFGWVFDIVSVLQEKLYLFLGINL